MARDQKQSSVTLLTECSEFKGFVEKLDRLETAVRTHRVIDSDLADWRGDIENQPGHASIGKVRTAIQRKAGSVRDSAKTARTILAELRDGDCHRGPFAARRKRYQLQRPPGATSNFSCRKPSSRCSAQATWSARILELDELARDLDALHKALTPFGDKNNWEDDAYIFERVTPQADKIQTLAVKVATVTLSSVATDGIVRTVGKDLASASVVIRGYRTFAPEIGAGLVVSSIRRPTYGTTTNAEGATVVARKDDEDISLSGALMLNGVCRCGMQSFAYPMFQVGALIDTKTPGILFGAGLRFLRPSHLGLATGAALTWIKDLDTLSVGSPVGGTTDIENDLQFKPTVKLYFTLQYTF